MVKRSRVLETEVEADVPYEATALARRAAKARQRLALLVLLGAAGFALESVLARSVGMGLAALALVVIALGVRKDKLAAVVGAALAAILGALVPFALMFLGEREVGETVIMGFVIAWALLLLPDVLTLVRDAELQYAYGRWARRDG